MYKIMTVVTFSLEVVTIVIVPLFIIIIRMRIHTIYYKRVMYVSTSTPRPIHPHYAFYEGIHP